MRKKLLAVVSVCLAVLLVAAGVYAYISNLKTKKKTFIFSWEGPIAEKFNVSTFWMKVTFERMNETHLAITIETNHLRYNEVKPRPPTLPDDEEWNVTYRDADYVGIVFNLGTENFGTRYLANGEYWHSWLEENGDEQRFLSKSSPAVGITGTGLHECYFDPERGYTYMILVELADYSSGFLSPRPVNSDLIHIEYDWMVLKEFHFGEELI